MKNKSGQLDRPTPETDAVAEAVGMGHFMVDADFARRLERERDEAREEWGRASMDAAQLLSEKTKAMAERDELQNAIKTYYRAKGRYNSQIAAAKMFELVGLTAEYPKMKKEAK